MEQVRRVRLGLLVGWAVGGVLALWAVMYVLAGSGIARGTTVAGVPIGGRTAAQARALLQQQLGPRATAPIRVRVGDVDGEVSPRDAGLAFDVAATVDAARARSWNPIALIADALAANIEKPTRDATFRIVKKRPRVVPASLGKVVAPDALAAAVLPVLTRSGDERRAAAGLVGGEPALSTEQARRLGVDELVSEYTTYYPSDFPPRLTNIHRAADLMDGTLVLPGAVFSLNDTVGERTAERGFAAGFIINNGKLEVDYGGGVSQLATTTFNAAFFAGLEIVEHHPHSFYISRYPEGRESTVAWGFKDVRVRNDSEHGIFITTAYTNSSVTVRVWGTKRFGIESIKNARYDVKPFTTVHDARPAGTQPGSCVATEGVPGFKVDVFRVFLRNGAEVDREKFHTVYAPENKVICGTSGRQ